MTPVSSKKPVSLPTIVNLQNPKEIHNSVTPTPPPAAKITSQANGNSFINEQDTTSVSVKPSHRRRPSTTKLDIEGLSITTESGLKSGSDTAKVTISQRKVISDDANKDSSQEKTKEIQKDLSPSTFSLFVINLLPF